MELLTYGNAKIVKGESEGFLTAILHLAPSNISGYNVCASASEGCKLGCLNRAGRGIYQKTQNARIRRTHEFFADVDAFMVRLAKDIRTVTRKAHKMGLTPCIRLNGTSDIPWERIGFSADGAFFPNIMAMFPDIQFYDYRKITKFDNIPANYHLTFSRSEVNEMDAISALHAGVNVAVVFKKSLPSRWHGFKVIDGTTHDLRFLDPKNTVVGLVAKGPARRDTSGFVVHI